MHSGTQRRPVADPVANSRGSRWSRSRSPAAKAEPDPAYPHVAEGIVSFDNGQMW